MRINLFSKIGFSYLILTILIITFSISFGSVNVFAAPACDCDSDWECYPNTISDPDQCDEAGEQCCEACTDWPTWCPPTQDDIGLCQPAECAGDAVCDVMDGFRCKWMRGHTCSSDIDCWSDYCVDGYCCNSRCPGTCESCGLSGNEGWCTTRSANNNVECAQCYECDGTNLNCQPRTANNGKLCQEECTKCVSGVCTTRPADENTECGTCERCNGNPLVTCNAHSRAEGKGCKDDCKHCSSGSCVNRLQCADNECSSGEYCDQAGGDCTDPDTNSQAGERTCQNCISGGQHPYGEGWGFEGGTPYCCGDDSSEAYQTRSCSSGCSSSNTDRVCCLNANRCVYSGTCYSQGDRCAPWDADAIGDCSSGTWSETENCATKASEDSGDSGDDPTDEGDCTDYVTCAISAGNPYCTSSTYSDVCTSATQLTEYYASGASCPSKTYGCSDFEVAASGDTSDDPTTTGTCTAGTGAECSSNAFSTSAGTGGGTEGCVDSTECFSNGGSGGGNCIFTEYYAVDSGDACGGLDSCDSTTYDPDTNSNTCGECAGSNRFGIGGEDCNGASAGDCSADCCGDDSGENRLTCQDGGAGACAESTDDIGCCNNANDCVYNNACYSDQGITPNNLWICDQGTWRRLGVSVSVIATPSSVTTTWQNTSATAGVNCTPDSPAIQCDPNSYALYTSTTSISSCSTTYSDYILSDPQTISSHVWVCAAAQDTVGTEGFSDPAEFLVDQIAPTASLNPLPTWTTQNSVTVDWSGSDTGDSGIWRFDLHYRITDIYGSVIQGWTWWANPTSNPGSLTFSNMTNNRTYQFRIRARDNAGNIGGWSPTVGISVDLVDPTCQMANLPMYTTSSSFTVSWSGYDEESGIQYYNVQVRVGAGSWGYLNDPDGYHTTETQDNVNGADGNTYYFRCNATDVAGNEGPWSPVVNTTVDATPPVSSVDPLPPWLNVTSFTVSWNGSDGTSGIDCYDIQFDDGSGWGDWFTCTQTLSSTFGPGSPVNVTDNVTYSFRSRATDNAGNMEGWPPQPDTYTTIDLTPPQYDLRAYDQNGREISGYVVGVDTVIIRSVATDSTSGVMNNYVHYTLLSELGETIDSIDCGPASPYGGVSECNVTIDFAGAITLEYWVEVIDRAGNMVISDVFYIGTHPLANFREHNVYMSIGEIRTTGIQVRNMQNQADNITITISSNLPLAPYFIWVDDPDVEITGSNNETLIVKNVNPGATPPPFNVMLWSSDTASTYQVTLNASSALNISDSDQAAVKIGYPASFPGLNEWAIFVLIILAVFGYVWFGREMR